MSERKRQPPRRATAKAKRAGRESADAKLLATELRAVVAELRLLREALAAQHAESLDTTRAMSRGLWQLVAATKRGGGHQ